MKYATLKQRTKSFGFQIASFYLVASLLVIVLFSTVIYFFASGIFVKEAISKTEMATEKSANSIAAYIQYTKNSMNFLAENTGSMPASIQSVAKSDPHILGIYAVFQDGRFWGSQDESIMEHLEAKDYNSESPFLTSARNQSYEHKDKWVVTMSLPIKSGDGTIQGTVIADLDYCMFKNNLADLDMGETGYIYIANSDKKLVFHSNEAYLNNGKGNQEDTSPQETGYDAETNILTYSHEIDGTDWRLVSSQSLENLKMLKKQLFDLVCFTGVLLFITLLCISTFFSRKLTKPISNLVHRMEDIESLASIVVVSEPTEAKVLTESYNLMIEKIKRLMLELSDTERAQRQAEMDALTSQINPHFLYNTLDTIVWLAEFRDNDKIIALTKSLAAFFRLSLNGGRAEVSLFDEIEHVKQYLFIQKERYGDKLTYTFTVEESLFDTMLPKIILQPLVENSIYHGIKPMDGIGLIEIFAKQSGDEIVLSVKDNGVGFDTGKSWTENSKSGVGLKNIENRIKLYFGDGARLEVKSEVGEGTEVWIYIKCKYN